MSGIDAEIQRRWFDRQLDTKESEEPILKGGGGGGTYNDMEARVTRLETHMEYVRRDLDELKTGQVEILNLARGLATKHDLWAWKWQWTALAFAVVATVIGGIIGGLSWIQPEDKPTQVQPIVLTVPALQAAPTSAAPKR
jgi:hypothetical protein